MYNYLKYAVFMLFYINLDIYCEYMNIYYTMKIHYKFYYQVRLINY